MYTKRLYVSGGSFYELQAVFDHVPGVVATRTGYIDAQSEEPSYDAVKSGWIKAVMGLEIAYNPKKTDISQLLDILFAVVNPYEKDGQGTAKGPMYQSGVYYVDAEDAPLVEYHMNFIVNRGRPPAATEANVTVNDPNHNKQLTRRCYAKAAPLVSFHPAGPERQQYLARHPHRKTTIDFKRLHELGILQ